MFPEAISNEAKNKIAVILTTNGRKNLTRNPGAATNGSAHTIRYGL
jgi:hypothetical protein